MSANPPADAQFVAEMTARVDAERTGRPFLVFRDGDARQQLFFFMPDSASASVGRQPSSDLVLDWDDQVSRLHARFERVDDGWEVVDDAPSRNGTFVNQKRVRGRCRLNDGDTVRFGATPVTFRSPARDQPAAADATNTLSGVELSSTQRRVLVALCRPYKGRSGFASPATNEQIAEELFLSVGAVKTHPRVLFAKFGVDEPPSNETRVRLVERAFSAGLISERDL